MTVTITGPVEDVTGIADNASWQFASVLRFTEDGTLVTAKPKVVYPVAGILTVKLAPGPAIVTYGKQAWNVTVPDADGTLRALIEAGIAFPPDTAQELLAAAVSQYVEEHSSDWTVTLAKNADGFYVMGPGAVFVKNADGFYEMTGA